MIANVGTEDHAIGCNGDAVCEVAEYSSAEGPLEGTIRREHHDWVFNISGEDEYVVLVVHGDAWALHRTYPFRESLPIFE